MLEINSKSHISRPEGIFHLIPPKKKKFTSHIHPTIPNHCHRFAIHINIYDHIDLHVLFKNAHITCIYHIYIHIYIYFIILYYILLYYIILYSIILLYYILFYYIILYYIILYYILFYYIISYYIILYYIILYCIILYYIILYYRRKFK